MRHRIDRLGLNVADCSPHTDLIAFGKRASRNFSAFVFLILGCSPFILHLTALLSGSLPARFYSPRVASGLDAEIIAMVSTPFVAFFFWLRLCRCL